MVFDRSRLDGYTRSGLINPDFGAGWAFSLGMFSTVYHAEMAAILECVEEIERSCTKRQPSTQTAKLLLQH